MKRRSADLKGIAHGLSGKRLSGLEAGSARQLEIQFEDGDSLLIGVVGGRLSIELADAAGNRPCPDRLWPTTRQREYLEFIAKYIGRFGRSPAESDIQRHFLVSAPSVNDMVQGLERRGFIERQPGVSRSIRVVDPSVCVTCGGTHHRKAGAVNSRLVRRVVSV
jgi:repressor LexA